MSAEQFFFFLKLIRNLEFPDVLKSTLRKRETERERKREREREREGERVRGGMGGGGGGEREREKYLHQATVKANYFRMHMRQVQSSPANAPAEQLK